MSAKTIIKNHAAEFGLDAGAQIDLLCEFIDNWGDKAIVQGLQGFVDGSVERSERAIFTFSCEDVCHECEADLTKQGSIGVSPQGEEMSPYHVDEHGVIAEENGAQLCLDDREPLVKCNECGTYLDVEAQPE